jgi:DNA-binding Lrp family transcriptional regulator
MILTLHRIVFHTSLTLLLLPQVCCAQSDHRNPRVEALLAPLGAATDSSVYLSKGQSSKDHKEMVEKLEKADIQTLRLLMDEVTNIGVLEKNESTGLSGISAYRAYRINEAFQIVGTNAAPLLPELKSEFLSGKSIYASESGLLAIGEDGWSILFQGLTNSNLRVQIATAAIMSLATGTNVSVAFPYLSHFATNYSTPSELRISAVESIVDLTVAPKTKLPILIQAVKGDTNIEIRCEAIKEIGRLGIYNEEVQKCLERAGKDQNEHVRVAVETALQELNAAK